MPSGWLEACAALHFCIHLSHLQPGVGRSILRNPGDHSIMAIISSTAVGNGQKSAGVLTYRRTRGRTIASQRVVTNKSNTPLQQTQREQFRATSHILSVLAFLINATCEKSKYGSSRNNFFKTNVTAFGEADLDKLKTAAAQSTPYNTLLHCLFCITTIESYWAIGSGNGIVTPGTILGQNILTGSLSITAYNATAAQCKATKVAINKDGSIAITDISSQITNDEGGASCSLNATASGSTSEINFEIIAFQTPQGIVTNQYILAKALPADPYDTGGSPGDV